MALASAEDIRLVQKNQAFCGSFSVPIAKLKFKFGSGVSYRTNQQKTKGILKQFKLVGCRQQDPENHIPALIPLHALPRGLRPAPENPLDFNPEDDIIYLCGRHRLEAAKQFLNPSNTRWVVDLYSDGWASPHALLYFVNNR
jgi:hypothetical protein